MVQIYIDSWWVMSGILLNISSCNTFHSLFMQLLFNIIVFTHSVRIYQAPSLCMLSSVTVAHKWEQWSEKEIATMQRKSTVFHFSEFQFQSQWHEVKTPALVCPIISSRNGNKTHTSPWHFAQMHNFYIFNNNSKRQCVTWCLMFPRIQAKKHGRSIINLGWYPSAIQKSTRAMSRKNAGQRYIGKH